MARSTVEHEEVIDRLDAALVFAFAFEHEMGRARDLGHLREMAEVVRQAISVHPVFLLQLGRRSPLGPLVSMVSRVMNGLQAAAVDGVMPEYPDLRHDWANMPTSLSAEQLEIAQASHVGALIDLATAVLERVDTSFPPEARPFISQDQFLAAARRTLLDVPGASAVPIHLVSLAKLLHTKFHEALKVDAKPGAAQIDPRSLVADYCNRTLQTHAQLVEERFSVGLMRELFDRAVALEIPLGKYFSWGALCSARPSATNWLDRYADMNRSGVLTDTKFQSTRGDALPEPSIAQRFIRELEATTPQALTASGIQLYFNTDTQEIRIDGLAVQKRAVMAVPYDAPLPEIDGVLRHYGMFLVNLRRKHCAVTRGRLNAREATAAARLVAEIARQSRGKRVTIHDQSSVLGQLCGLRALEMQRDEAYAGASTKARTLTIVDWVEKAGFRYSLESVRKECAALAGTLAAVKEHLAGM